MSLSQKHVGKVFVPWFNTAEWKHVYNILCSQSDKNYALALCILKIWKCRTPLLSAGVEGTLIILEALLTEKETVSEHQLTQIYAISIMRFLNLCATSNEKQGTFFKTALKNELPKWLINIRHDIAHDHKLPSVSILELGLRQCLEWIKIKYWQVQNEIICDYTVIETMESPKVIDILEIYVELNLKLFSKSIDISEYDENIIERINEIIFKDIAQPTTDISDIISILEEYLSENFKKLLNDSIKEQVSKILVNALLSTELEITSEGAHIPREFRNIWSILLNMVNDNSLMSLIFNKLVDVTNNIEFENTVRQTAALWINELLLGLQKAQLVGEELDNIKKNNPAQLDKLNIHKIKSTIEEKYPQCEDSLEFSSSNILWGDKTIQDKILKTPNNYTLQFLEKALRFNKNSENCIADTVNLVQKMLLPKLHIPADEEIFTVDQLGDINVIIDQNMEKTDSEETVIMDVNTNITEVEKNRWKPVQDTTIFKDCPLGISSYQNRNKNPLLTI